VLTSAILVARQFGSHEAGAQRACLRGPNWLDTPPQNVNGLPEAGTPATTRCRCDAPAYRTRLIRTGALWQGPQSGHMGRSHGVYRFRRTRGGDWGFWESPRIQRAILRSTFPRGVP